MKQTEQAVLSVNQLNTLAKDILESSFPHVLVEGEISNLVKAGSGHIYFTLKDDKAQISVALFANSQRGIKAALANGQKVQVSGKLSLFSNRGNYQLIARRVDNAGEGDLRRQFEALKIKLEEAGWFAPEHKKALPLFPTHLAVVTSPSGAAIRDVLHVLERRFPLLEVTIIPSLVQGDRACEQLCHAIETANRLKATGDERFQFDLILLTRGGGSLEDLWPFNEEALAATIYHSELPIISGVGHEIDYSICDWVADYRAPTPSAAAESLSQDQDVLLRHLKTFESKLKNLLQQRLSTAQQLIYHLARRNISPRQKLQEQQQKVDYLEQSLFRSLSSQLKHKQNQLEQMRTQLHANKPDHRLALARAEQQALTKRLLSQYRQAMNTKRTQLRYLARQLHNLSPLSTLERGYSISLVHDGEQTRMVSEHNPGKVGQTLITRLGHGNIESTITQVTLHREEN